MFIIILIIQGTMLWRIIHTPRVPMHIILIHTTSIRKIFFERI